MSGGEERPPDVVTVPGLLLRQVVELLITLGDHVGNVDCRTGIDRCAVVGELRKLLGVRAVESRPFDLLWAGKGSSGEERDVVSTVEDVRRRLSLASLAHVRVRVGTREFGEKVLAALDERERARVRIVLGGTES